MMRFRKSGLTGRARIAFLVALTAAIINIAALAASASAEGEELRRVDTANVNKATDVKAVGESETEAGHGEPSDDSEAASEAEAHGETEEEGHHAPAWMIPGWQSIFTVLAVIYFGLGVTLLPRIMAKEEH